MNTRRKKPRRFAEGTKTPAMQTRTAIEKMLVSDGADQLMNGNDVSKERAFIQFTMAKRMFRIYIDYAKRKDRAPEREQREREAWRVLLLLVKAKLQLIRMGESSPEAEFLANVLMPDGSTVGDHVLPAIAETYASGKMPKLLGMGSGG
jgi:hypothetical protein